MIMKPSTKNERDSEERDLLSVVCGLPVDDMGPRDVDIYRVFMEAYFDHCRREISSLPVLEHSDVMSLIRFLKKNAGENRSDLQSMLVDYCQQQSRTDHDDSLGKDVLYTPLDIPGISKKLSNAIAKKKVPPGAVLSTVVRVMLALQLNVAGPDGLGPMWEEGESLQHLVSEIFRPEEEEVGTGPMPIKKSKLGARYMQDYACLKLVWTDKLSDHLLLVTDRVPKELHIFQYVSLLQGIYEGMRRHGVSFEPDEGKELKGGSYNPTFIWETLMTYRLIFPSQDLTWLDKIIKQGKATLGRESGAEKHPVDGQLIWPSTVRIPWSQRTYEWPVRSTSELFKRYPHWAVRLQLMFEEADDPTPVSATDMWADRHKASRHSFYITFVAFAVAILFGVFSLVLGSVQIWIAYCTWHPTNSGICWTAPANDTAPANETIS